MAKKLHGCGICNLLLTFKQSEGLADEGSANWLFGWFESIYPNFYKKIFIFAGNFIKQMGKGSLFKELFVNIKTTGAITFSSRSLVNKMLSFADFREAKVLVELGGGDGSITRGIVSRMDKGAELLVFEISRAFCDSLEKEFPQDNVKIICDSAEHLDKYLEGRHADLILSSLPLSLIPKDSRNEIYRKSSQCLHPKGLLIQICYSYLLKFQYAPFFKTIKTTFTLKNFPPTLIMICRP